MSNKPIDRAVAKSQLARINQVLPHPHLLIGGLAVQKYHEGRLSKDIDLVCNFDVVQKVLLSLYPSRDWRVEDKQNNEYRPSYQIEHKVEDYGIIIFGPKIAEREPYNHIDWAQLLVGAESLETSQGVLENIKVPTAHALAYTKFISFLSRSGPDNKVRADLQDFVDLTNHSSFSVSVFFDLLRKSRAEGQLSQQFRSKVVTFADIWESSCLASLARMLLPAEAISPAPPTQRVRQANFAPGSEEARIIQALERRRFAHKSVSMSLCDIFVKCANSLASGTPTGAFDGGVNKLPSVPTSRETALAQNLV